MRNCFILKRITVTSIFLYFPMAIIIIGAIELLNVRKISPSGGRSKSNTT